MAVEQAQVRPRRAGAAARRGRRRTGRDAQADEASVGELIGPLLFSVGRLQRDGDREGRPGAEVDAELFARLEHIRGRLERDHGMTGERLRDVTYALVAFVDERLTRAPDPLGAYFREAFWERRLFDSSDAGVDFFEILEKYLGARDLEVLEVYYRCLMLGFAGKYRGGREHELDGSVERLLDVLDEGIGLSAVPLSPHAKPPLEARHSRRRNGWLSTVVLAFLTVAVVVYAGSCVRLQTVANDLVECVPVGNGDRCRFEEEVD